MATIRGRLLLLVVAVTAVAALFVGWIGGLARGGLLGVTGTVGFVASLLLFVSILVAIWFILDGRRSAG